MYRYLVAVLFLIVLIYLLLRTKRNETSLHQVNNPEMYNCIEFLEAKFPTQSNKKQYQQEVEHGYTKMSKLRLSIVGLAYNLGKDKIQLLLDRLEYLAKPWHKVQVIVYAADSTDDTLSTLHSAQPKHFKLVVPLETIDKQGLTRMEKMAKLRNKYLDVLDESQFNPDYVLMLDLDLVGPVSRDGLAHSTFHLETKRYDALFANGIVNWSSFNWQVPFFGWTYYDPLALVTYEGNESSSDLFDIIRSAGFVSIVAYRGEKIIPVRSAFAGAGLYRYSAIKGVRYPIQKSKCEHKGFNLQLYDQGHKLGINPSLILLSGIQGETFHKRSVSEEVAKKYPRSS